MTTKELWFLIKKLDTEISVHYNRYKNSDYTDEIENGYWQGIGYVQWLLQKEYDKENEDEL